MSRRKVLLLAGLAVMVLLAVIGCSLLVRGETGVPAGAGGSIQIRIQAPAAARGITVTDFDVTGMNIQVLDPQDLPLASIEWVLADGTQSYPVPVQQAGEHEVVVTHYGERDGQQVQATERAACNIQSMKITVIDIVPGCIGVIRVEGGETPEPVDLTGYWDAILTPEGGTATPPHLVYLKQTGSSLNGLGMIGTVEGSAVTVDVDEGALVLTGTIAPDGTINGTCVGFVTGAFELRRSVLAFGTFALSGFIDLNTDRGLAAETDWNACEIDFMDEDREVGLSLCSWFGPLSTGSYLVPDQLGVQVNHWSDDAGEFSAEALSGTVVITSCEEGIGIDGYFESVVFPEGALSGSFNVSFELNGYN